MADALQGKGLRGLDVRVWLDLQVGIQHVRVELGNAVWSPSMQIHELMSLHDLNEALGILLAGLYWLDMVSVGLHPLDLGMDEKLLHEILGLTPRA